MAGLGVLSRKDRRSTVVDRLRALGEAAAACQGRVDDASVSEARRVVSQADRRLALSGAATVVALAGATGSGKSSLFNALSGTELATVGMRRPTTSRAMAAIWGGGDTEALLDWLEIPRRHTLPGAAELDGLVLLDLPDHDSTEVEHRLEVDRLVQLVDVLVWVVDPQKYADAALHDRYLRPLARHADVMLVVLNQVDRLTAAERDECLQDLRRLLAAEGLGRATVLGVSATAGVGLQALRSALAEQVADKQAAARRLDADVTVAAEALAAASGTAASRPLGKAAVEALNIGVAAAAGVPVVTEAVGNAWRLRGSVATGWPMLAWLGKLKPDPLRRLHLDRLGVGGRRRAVEASPGQTDPADVGRSSLPATSGVQQARVDAAVRTLADEAAVGLSRGWADAVKRAARSTAEVLPDRVDRAVASTDLEMHQGRRWWRAVRVVQWALLIAVVAGLVWLSSAFVLSYLQLPPLPDLRWRGVPVPTLLAVGGVLAGLLLAGAARIGVEVGARRRIVRARQRLRSSIARVTAELVVGPVRVEQARYDQARTALQRALG